MCSDDIFPLRADSKSVSATVRVDPGAPIRVRIRLGVGGSGGFSCNAQHQCSILCVHTLLRQKVFQVLCHTQAVLLPVWTFHLRWLFLIVARCPRIPEHLS